MAKLPYKNDEIRTGFDLGVKFEPRSYVGHTYSLREKLPANYIERISSLDFIPGIRYAKEGDQLHTIAKQIVKKLTNFRLGLYLLGVDIGYNRVQYLVSLDLINGRLKNAVAEKHLNLIQTKYINKFVINKSGELIAEYKPDKGTPDFYLEDMQKAGNLSASDLHLEAAIKEPYQNQNITKADWKIDDVFELPDDVYEMIMLINKGWQFFEQSNRKWERFDNYRLQAARWLKNNYTFDTSLNEEGQIQFLKEERERCLENSLYLANKYLWYKDSDNPIAGEQKFIAWKAQEVVLFLMDLGLSLIIGKLRQIGFSTVIGGVMGLRAMLSKNFYCKMVAQKEKKSEELFKHKIQYAIEKADWYMKPTIPNWSTDKVDFGFGEKKGAEKSSSSTFEVCAPTSDAINAGTPSVTLLDEIGFMKMFGEIVSQGRPTMFKFINGKMVMTKQIIAWGTGGKTGGAGSAMEVEWKAAKEALKERNFRHGLIPLFLNFYAKPGHTDEFYLAEKKYYYSKKKQVGEEDPKIVFHQSFPITEDDMFLESSDTVISIAAINLNIDRIHKKISAGKLVSVRGYFEPVYNTEKKRGEQSYVPFDIIGARFIPADESLIQEDSPFACVTMFEKPDLEYENLYYKGTDPIFTATGHSKFASVIKRADSRRTVAYVNYKSEDYRYEYCQSLLLNLYYSREHAGRKLGIKELLEFNVGGEYYNFCRELGYGGIMVGNKMLPDSLQTTTMDIGINKRGNNSVMIVNRLEEMLMDYASVIDSIDFWVQLKTFVKKMTSTGTKYEPLNKKIHYDDLIDAETYAKICLDVYGNKPIRKISMEAASYDMKNKRRYYLDSNHNLCLGSYSIAEKFRKRNAA